MKENKFLIYELDDDVKVEVILENENIFVLHKIK